MVPRSDGENGWVCSRIKREWGQWLQKVCMLFVSAEVVLIIDGAGQGRAAGDHLMAMVWQNQTTRVGDRQENEGQSVGGMHLQLHLAEQTRQTPWVPGRAFDGTCDLAGRTGSKSHQPQMVLTSRRGPANGAAQELAGAERKRHAGKEGQKQTPGWLGARSSKGRCPYRFVQWTSLQQYPRWCSGYERWFPCVYT